MPNVDRLKRALKPWVLSMISTGGLTGSGTSGRLAQWTGTTTLGSSSLVKTGAGVLTLDSGGAYTLSVTGTSTINGSLVGSITGGGTIATGGFTLTVPATGTSALGAGTLTAATTNNSALADHTHAITSSSNPGAAASILATDASGYTQLTGLGIGAAAGGARMNVVGTDNVIQLIVKGNSTQTKNIMEVQDKDGSKIMWANGLVSAFSDAVFVYRAIGVGPGLTTNTSAFYNDGKIFTILAPDDAASGVSFYGQSTTVLATARFATQKMMLTNTISATAANSIFHTLLINATTNAVDTVVTLGHDTSGTAANGFGARLLYQLESSTTAAQSAAAIDVLWTDATHATRTSALAFLTVNSAAALAEIARVSGAGLRVGDGTNYLLVSAGGFTTLVGTAKSKLAMRPAFVAGKISAGGAPTAVALGAFSGYSMPIWSTPANQYEELYWRLTVPGRWDGTTDIEYILTVCLEAAETENDDFGFQLSWANTNGTSGAISSTTVDHPTVAQNCGAGHTAQYSVFKLTFTIDVSAGPGGAVAAGDVLSGRVRRVASGGTEIDGEVIVLDHVLNFTVDKMFKAS